MRSLLYFHVCMYQLTLPTGNEISFPTMGDVLYHLNNSQEKAHSPYLGQHDDMHLRIKGVIYPIVQNHNNGLSPDMRFCTDSPYVLMAQWISEALRYAKAVTEAVLPPYLIRRSHWLAITSLSSIAYGVYSTFSAEQLNSEHVQDGKVYSSLSYFHSAMFYRLFGYGHNGPAYGNGTDTNCRHEVHVCYALARGDHVPDVVLADYADRSFPHDAKWFVEVLRKPFLRGAFKSVEHLDALVHLLRGEGMELTVDNVGHFVGLLAALPGTAGRIAVDNCLYEAGILSCRAQPARQDIGTPLNAFASRHRILLGQWKQKYRLKTLGKREEQTTVTLREYDFKRANIAMDVDRESFEWPNRVARALRDKHLVALLSILDGSQNEATKRAVEQECNVKLCDVTAQERRRAIFAIAGFVDDDAYLAEEERLKAEQKVREAEREFEQARNRASGSQIRMDGGQPMTCSEYVEALVRGGFNKIAASRRGACNSYYLTNVLTGESYPIGRPNGTLDYARLLLDQVAT
jgi:hypothetical protein